MALQPTFRHSQDEAAWGTVHPLVRWMVRDCLWFCLAHGKQMVVTSLVTPAPDRKSRTHDEGRAADVVCQPWDLGLMEEYGAHLNDRFVCVGGMRLAIVGAGDPSGAHDDHLHLQVCRPMRQDDWRILIG